MTNIYPKIYDEYFDKTIAWLGETGDSDGQRMFMLIKGLVDPNYKSRLTAAAALARFDELFPPVPPPPPAEKGGRRRATRRQRQQQQRQRQRQSRKSFQL